MKLLIQEEILKNYTAPLNIKEGQYISLSVENNKCWKQYLRDLDNDNSELIIPFVTIQVASYINLYCHNIKRGFLWPSPYDMYNLNNPLYYNVWSSYIDDEYLLNTDPIIKTYKQIIKDYDNSVSDKRIFVRPVSPWKIFTGFDCLEKELVFELKCRNINDHELCMIFPFKEINDVEWRCHYFNEKVVSVCPYSWNDNVDASKTDKKFIEDMAFNVGKQLEQVGDSFVIDLTNNGQVIEVNAVSTSGFYNGLDIQSIYDNLQEVFIE